MTSEKKITQPSSAGAGVAGASGGTFLALIAAGLDDTSVLKDWLYYAAPSASVVVSGVWLWIQARIINRVRDEEVKQVVNSAKSELEAALNNPNTSDQHKESIRKKLEELELVNIDRALKKLRGLEVVKAEDLA